MENRVFYIEPLVEKAEQYGKTSYELIKLKTIHASTKVVSKFLSWVTFFITMSIAMAVLNIGLALWLGDLLGKSYYGFFCLAAFYIIIGVVLYFYLNTKIKNRISNAIISQMLN